jgi:hypothetical protein
MKEALRYHCKPVTEGKSTCKNIHGEERKMRTKVILSFTPLPFLCSYLFVFLFL